MRFSRSLVLLPRLRHWFLFSYIHHRLLRLISCDHLCIQRVQHRRAYKEGDDQRHYARNIRGGEHRWLGDLFAEGCKRSKCFLSSSQFITNRTAVLTSSLTHYPGIYSWQNCHLGAALHATHRVLPFAVDQHSAEQEKEGGFAGNYRAERVERSGRAAGEGEARVFGSDG